MVIHILMLALTLFLFLGSLYKSSWSQGWKAFFWVLLSLISLGGIALQIILWVIPDFFQG